MPFDEDEPEVKPAAWAPQVEQGSALETQMKALALEDEPADSGRIISVPPSKKGRTHDNMGTVQKACVLLGPLAVPGYDGTIVIRKANSPKEYGEAQWIPTLNLAVEEQMQGGHPTLEEIYDTSSELMDQGALPEVERDPKPDNKKSIAVHRCRKVCDAIGAHGSHAWETMSNADFKQACHNIARKYGTTESRTKGHICTPCDKPVNACTHYLVVGEE